MKNSRWYIGGALSAAVTATLVATASLPAGADPAPVPSTGPGAGLPRLLKPILPPLPSPTRLPSLPALPPPPIVKPPAPPAIQPVPVPPVGPPTQTDGSPGTPPAPGQGAPQPGVAAPGNAIPATMATPDTAAAIIASDPAADLYPQPPVDPATTPHSRLVSRLDEVQHREQYLRNVLIRTRADLAVAQNQLGSVPPLVALLTAGAASDTPATAAGQGSVGSPEGRVLALSSAVDSGRAELSRRQTEALELQRQVNSSVEQAITTAAPASGTTASYGGGKLRQPVRGPITSTFGNRYDPYYHVWQLHAGTDIGAPAGTEIVAAAAGRVTQAGWSGGYGNYTCIDHGQVDGQRLSTCYGHQQKILVSPGQQVSAGQVIGQVGSTGASTGPHLHFEVRLGGRPVDPMPWI